MPRAATLERELARRFHVVSTAVVLGNRRFEVLRPRSAEELISEADFAVDERLPYWAEIWPSAVVLARQILEEPGASRTLLELGCGVGVVALAAIAAGYDVLATDYYADALRFTRANVWRVHRREIRTALFDWRAWPAGVGSFDRVVAADVLYERPHAEHVSAVIARSLAPSGEAWIADPGRVAAPAFLDACARSDVRLTQSETHPFTDETVRQRIVVYKLKREQGATSSA